MALKLAPQLAAFAALLAGTVSASGAFISGADFSHLGFFEDRGVVYRENGQAQEAFDILKQNGVNCIRLRLFTSSAAQAAADPYNYTNNLDYTLPLAVRAKQAGLQFCLDFHYSDTWADPGHQTKPAAWTNLTFAELEQQMYDYNSNCIANFKAAGAMPDYVQIGNEITGGMLWPDGRVGGSYDTPTQWSHLGRLMKAAIHGVLDASGNTPPQIIVHIDRGGDWNGTLWFFNNLIQQQIPFDIIGESYYPFWHGSLDDLRTCLNNAATRFQKPLVVAETAFPWGNSTDVLGIPATPEGQVQFVIELANVVNAVPEGRGVGILWWGSEYVSVPQLKLAGFDHRSFFDTSGNALPVVAALGQLSAPVRVEVGFSSSGLSLKWPLSGAGSVLGTSTNLASLGSWMPVTNQVNGSETGFSVTIPWSADQDRYYRLESQ